MFGIAVIGIILVYVLVCLGAGWLTFRTGRKHGWKLPWVWAILVMIAYNLPIANYVVPPVLGMNKYCPRAGFWLYKTPEQWISENPGVAQTLIESNESIKRHTVDGYERILNLNQRFSRKYLITPSGAKYVEKVEKVIVDRKTEEILAKQLDFRATAYYLYAPDSCFRQEVRSRWFVNGKSFRDYQYAFQSIMNLGEGQ